MKYKLKKQNIQKLQNVSIISNIKIKNKHQVEKYKYSFSKRIAI